MEAFECINVSCNRTLSFCVTVESTVSHSDNIMYIAVNLD